MAPPVPILLMIRELGLGGTERQLSAVARSLDPSKFAVHIGCFQDQGLRREELDQAGIPIVRFPVRSFRSPSLLTGALEMRRYIHKHGIRLVHPFDYPAIAFGIPVARTCANVVAVSSQRYHRSLRPGWPHHMQRFTDRLADAVVVNCEYLASHLREEEHVPAERIHLCYNGLDLDIFRPLPGPRRPEVADASLVLGVVCALRPEKDLGTLLTAFARVRNLRAGMKLLIVGDGSCKPYLQKQAQALGILDDCVFVPGKAEVAEFLRSIDVFVLPSLSEALSNSLMEAMACGCCAVASRTGGNVELVAEGRTGWLFEPGNATELAGVLQNVIEHDATRKDAAAEGRQFLQEGFSFAAMGRRMEEIYSALLRPQATQQA
jgi:glycosyltransferase involved in cell wall biosynthesis